jgi:hypothetical protein
MTPSASFQEDLAVAKNLAETDPHNADWQRSLSDSFNFVGEVLVAQGKLGEALQYFQEGLAVSDRLAKTHPSHPEAQASGDQPCQYWFGIDTAR